MTRATPYPTTTELAELTERLVAVLEVSDPDTLQDIREALQDLRSATPSGPERIRAQTLINLAYLLESQ